MKRYIEKKTLKRNWGGEITMRRDPEMSMILHG